MRVFEVAWSGAWQCKDRGTAAQRTVAGTRLALQTNFGSETDLMVPTQSCPFHARACARNGDFCEPERAARQWERAHPSVRERDDGLVVELKRVVRQGSSEL